MKEKKNNNIKNLNSWQKIVRFSTSLYYKVLRAKGSPEFISRGLASGVFIGMLPVLPLQSVLALILAYMTKGSKISALLGTWISNPLNWVPLYILFFYTGSMLLGVESQFNMNMEEFSILELIKSSPQLVLIMFVGALVYAIPSTIISYFVALYIIRVYQERKRQRMLKKEEEKKKIYPS